MPRPISFTFIAGDFNLHHPLWEPRRRPDPHAQDLVNYLPDLGVTLLSPADIHTHFPHRSDQAPSVIDLAWIDNTLRAHSLTAFRVDSTNRMGSDHAVLTADIPIVPDYITAPRIAAGSEAEQRYTHDLILLANRHATHDLSTVRNLRTSVTTFFQEAHAAFVRRAKTPRITSHSKLWWNEHCSQALAEFRTHRDQAHRKAFFTAIRQAK